MGLVVVGAMAGTAVVFGASFRQNRGVGWADSVCSAASALCASPGWLLGLSIGLALVYFYRISLKV